MKNNETIEQVQKAISEIFGKDIKYFCLVAEAHDGYRVLRNASPEAESYMLSLLNAHHFKDVLGSEVND